MAARSVTLVTGATGTAGSQVVSHLPDAGGAVRALVRNPDSARLPSGAEPVRGDLSNRADLTAALDDVAAVSPVRPFTSSEAATDLAPGVLAAIAERTQRIVSLSAEVAATGPEAFWAKLEQHVERCAAQWTLLRPTGFAENTLRWADQIRADGFVTSPERVTSTVLEVNGVPARAIRDWAVDHVGDVR